MIYNYCKIHHVSSTDGPCPWPDCPNGCESDTYVSTNFGLSPEEYRRDFFIAADDAPRYFWISDTESYGWVIRKVIKEEFERLTHTETPVMYHYTTLEGLQGIIDSSDLWLTESQFLNDASEVNHGIELSREIFNELNISASPINEFLQEVINTPSEKRPRINIACFSNAQDSLSQWRAYSGGMGVSIGFRTMDFLRSFGYPDCRLNYVLYDDNKKRLLLRTYFKFKVEAYERDSTRKIKVLERDLSYREHLPITGYDTTLQYLYFELMNSLKHSDFVDEREIRLFYTEHKSILNSFDLESAKVRFRKGNGFLVPYTTIGDIRTAGRRDFKKDQLAIAEIMIGPHERSELAALSVRRLLDERGYHEVDVVRSKSPYR